MKQTNNNGAGAQGAAVPQTEKLNQVANQLTEEQRTQVYALRTYIYSNGDKELIKAIGAKLQGFTPEQREYFYNQMF